MDDALNTLLEPFLRTHGGTNPGAPKGNTREDAESRIWRKKRKLEAMLDEDGNKPKGLHWRTYERICDQLDNLEGKLEGQSFLRALRIVGW
jgi:hypothetical protein